MKKSIIWLVIAIIILAAAILGGIYFFTDTFKTPEQLFFSKLSKSLNAVEKTDYLKALDEFKKATNSEVDITGEISAKLQGEGTDEISSVLEKGKLVYNFKNAGKSEKMQGDLTLNYDNKDIITINMLKNKDQYGIKVEDAYDKYISVENNNLKALFNKLGMDSTYIPDKIEMVDYYELLAVDQKTLNHIEKTYGKAITESIPKECYTAEKNVNVKIDGEEAKTNAYKLTLTGEQFSNILIKVFETLKTDDVTLELMLSKANLLEKQYEQYTLITEEEKLTKEKLVDEINDMLEDLKNSSSEASDAKLEFVVYSEKDQKYKIVETIKNKEEVIAKVEADIVKGTETKLNLKSTAEDVTFEVKAVYDNKNVDATITFGAGEDNIKMDLTADEKSANTKITLSLEGIKAEINVTEKVNSTKNVSVEDFTTSNSVKLNDMTKEEIQQLAQTISQNFSNKLAEKMQLLGINPNSL